MYGFVFLVKGDGKGALNHLHNAVEYGEKVQFQMVLMLSWTYSSWVHYLLDELESAQQLIERSMEIQRTLGAEVGLSLMYSISSSISFGSGHYGTALEWSENAVAQAQRNHEKDSEGRARIWRGRILAKADPSQKEKAEESIRTGTRILEELKLRALYADGYLALGELCVDAGEKEAALEHLRKAEGMFAEMGMDHYLNQTRGVLERVQSA
jgi:tetratricopeptide (TPR) repeat protein